MQSVNHTMGTQMILCLPIGFSGQHSAVSLWESIQVCFCTCHASTGAICGSGAFIGALMDLHMGPVMLLGPTMDPAIASQLSLRLPHLGLRMAEHSRRALAYAERLQQVCTAHVMLALCCDSKPCPALQLLPSSSPWGMHMQEGAAVSYPGLLSHPQHALMQRLRNADYGFGGILTLDLGSLQARFFLDMGLLPSSRVYRFAFPIMETHHRWCLAQRFHTQMPNRFSISRYLQVLNLTYPAA